MVMPIMNHARFAPPPLSQAGGAAGADLHDGSAGVAPPKVTAPEQEVGPFEPVG
jgi:hypothetical protein